MSPRDAAAAAPHAAHTRGFTAGEPYWVLHPQGPSYGQDLLAISVVNTRSSFAVRSIDLTTLPQGYRDTFRDLVMVLAQPDHPAVVEAGIVRRAAPAPAASVYEAFISIRQAARWGQETRSLASFTEWTQSDTDAYLEAMKLGQHRRDGTGTKPHSAKNLVELFKTIYDARLVIADPFSFAPWGRRTSASLTQTVRAPENETPPLPWPTWAPLVAASWAFVSRYATDILAGLAALKRLPEDPRGPTGPAALDRFDSWRRAGGRVPLHTGLGRGTGAQNRGELNKRLLLRLTGIGSAALNSATGGYNRALAERVDTLLNDPTACSLGGLYQATVPASDTDLTPWAAELGPEEVRHLVSALRGACYVLIASLTGMRDGEIQALTTDAATELNGQPALRSTQHKGRSRGGNTGEQRTWWAPEPVLTAVNILKQLTPHPTHLFARSSREVLGDYNANRDIARLTAFINDGPQARVGRGGDLALTSIDLPRGQAINATSLRRSFAVYATTRPGAELGLGIQLGHAAWRMTSGYAADGRQAAVRHLDEQRRTLLRDQAAALVTGHEPLAGPAKGTIADFRAQVVTDPARATQLIDRLADRLHYGLTNDCMWDPLSSACGNERPQIAAHICAGEDCANALYGPAHVGVLTDAIDRIDAYLDTAPAAGHLVERMRANRTQLARTLRQLIPNDLEESQ